MMLTIAWTIVAPNLKPIRVNCGVEVLPWEVFPDPSSFDYLVVVGGRVGPQKKTNRKVYQYLQRVAENGNTIIGLCTASFVLARAGVMKSRSCCVHWLNHLGITPKYFLF